MTSPAAALRLVTTAALALLAFERSRAASAPRALSAWATGLAAQAARRRRVGRRAHLRLLEVEMACRRAGLTYAEQAADAAEAEQAANAAEAELAANAAEAEQAADAAEAEQADAAARAEPADGAGAANAEPRGATGGATGSAEATDGGRPPWRLPESFLTLPAHALPPHPLVDPALLAAELAAASVAPPSALDAIAWLLDARRVAARWADAPSGNDADDASDAAERAAATGAATPPAAGSARIAVCLHLYYTELWPELRDQLAALPEPWDLFVTLPDIATTTVVGRIRADVPGVVFVPGPNRGRDVLPWLGLLRSGRLDRYEFVCKLHGKKSPHTRLGAAWRRDSLGALLGHPANTTALLEALRADASIGVLGPAAALTSAGDDAARRHSAAQLGRLIGRLPLGAGAATTAWPFFAGTMFWYRPAALRPLAALGLVAADFPPEMAQTDGTLAHAVERVVVAAAAAAGHRCAAWAPEVGQARWVGDAGAAVVAVAPPSGTPPRALGPTRPF